MTDEQHPAPSIAPTLYAIRPSSPLLNIHDNLSTTQRLVVEGITLYAQIIYDEFLRLLDLIDKVSLHIYVRDPSYHDRALLFGCCWNVVDGFNRFFTLVDKLPRHERILSIRNYGKLSADISQLRNGYQHLLKRAGRRKEYYKYGLPVLGAISWSWLWDNRSGGINISLMSGIRWSEWSRHLMTGPRAYIGNVGGITLTAFDGSVVIDDCLDAVSLIIEELENLVPSMAAKPGDDKEIAIYQGFTIMLPFTFQDATEGGSDGGSSPD